MNTETDSIHAKLCHIHSPLITMLKGGLVDPLRPLFHSFYPTCQLRVALMNSGDSWYRFRKGESCSVRREEEDLTRMKWNVESLPIKKVKPLWSVFWHHISYHHMSRDGAVVRALAFHQCGPGSIPTSGVIRGLSLLVLYSAPRGFSSGTLVFPSPQNPT